MTKSFPFPIVWERPLDWFCIKSLTPHLTETRLTLRCGDQLAQFSSSNGDLLWNTLIAERAGDGTFLIAHDNLFLTDFTRRSKRLSAIAAIASDGETAWRFELPSILTPGAAAVVGDNPLTLSVEPGEGSVFHYIDIRNHRLKGRFQPAWGADSLLPLSGDKLLISNRLAEQQDPGLYTMRLDGSDPRPIRKESTWRLKHQGHLIFAVTRNPDQQRYLRVLDVESLTELWSAPSVNEAMDVDDGNAYHLESQDGKDYLVARLADTGKMRWRAGPLATTVLRIEVAGAVLLCAHLGGVRFYRSKDGADIGAADISYGSPVSENNRMYVMGGQSLVWASLAAGV